MAEPTTTSIAMPPEVRDFAKQEVRLAAVLNGGVSLAVWMSGVTLEFQHVALASSGLGSWQTYAEVLDALGATARVDVIAGTSAGGLNGAFLALGLARKLDFTGLRDVWAEAGALERLLRKPLSKNPPSALAGDGYFLPKIRGALTDMTTKWHKLDPEDQLSMPPVDLILTGTLWNGRKTRFADDMGVAITERDYNATFRFTSRPPADDTRRPAGQLTRPDRGPDAVLDQLASAARCTSSFPAAFETHYVKVTKRDPNAIGPEPPGRWPSSAGQSNFDTSQYVLDGGILLNKPLRPALDAIYSQTAQQQVRRVLGYVVPDPGEPPSAPATETVIEPVGAPEPPVPVATDVLLGVLTRLTSTDSVSRELAEIRDTNLAVRTHRHARGRLSLVMAQAAPTMVEQLWPGYREERINDAAQTIAELIAQGESARAESISMTDRWSVQELIAGLRRIGSGQPGFGFVPGPGDPQAAVAQSGPEWSWGQTSLVRLADMTIDLMKRAVMLAPLNSPAQQAVVAKRGEVRSTLHQIAAFSRDLERFWAVEGIGQLPPPPRRLFAGAGSGSATNVGELDDWLARLVKLW
ncbi:MAG TPA: patatin-like protein, partial [Jatrophihabitans sp.]|nr:patatin-like protein [Jatrophihabitans sp.]